VKLRALRAGLPGNVDIITWSALTPLRESVTALPAPAYGQEGGASSRLARESPVQGAPFDHWSKDTISFGSKDFFRPKGDLNSFHFLQFLIVPLRTKGHGHEVLPAGPLSR
jgi:hypothetical protein